MDHNLIVSKIIIEDSARTRKIPIYLEKYNIEFFESESTRHLYEKRLSNKLGKENSSNYNIEDNWNKLKTCITEAAKKAIGIR